MKKRTVILLAASVLILLVQTFSQTEHGLGLDNKSQIRVSSFANYSGSFFPFGATYSLSKLSFGLADWHTSSLKLIVGEEQFDDLPFNLTSLNLLPYSSLNVDQIIVKRGAEVSHRAVSSYGIVNFKKRKIDAGFSSKLKIYTGSETGDPLVHKFTKNDSTIINKNKRPPSFEFSSSYADEKLGARISLGYHSTYATSSVNQELLYMLNTYYFSKSNKQFTGSAEIQARIGSLKLEANYLFSSFYGWEVPPSIGYFLHIENYNHRAYVKISDLQNKFEILILRDEFLGENNKTKYTLPSKFSVQKYRLKPKYKLISNKNISAEIYSSIDYIRTQNRNDHDTPQEYFSKNIGEFEYQFGSEFKHTFNNKWNALYNLNYSKYFTAGDVSGSFQLSYKPDLFQWFTFKVASAAQRPSLDELLSNFSAVRSTSQISIQPVYEIKGDRSINNTRSTILDLTYQIDLSFFSFLVNPAFMIVENPVRLKNIQLISGEKRNDLLRSALYTNGEKIKLPALNLEAGFEYSNLRFSCSINYKDNSELKQSPRYKMNFEFGYRTFFGGHMIFNFYLIGKTQWDNYKISTNRSSVQREYTGELQQITSLDIGYIQKFDQFYFLDNLSFIIRINNILNKQNRFHPIGNIFEREFLLMINLEI